MLYYVLLFQKIYMSYPKNLAAVLKRTLTLQEFEETGHDAPARWLVPTQVGGLHCHLI